MKISHALMGLCLIFFASCKTAKQDADSPAIEGATWQNWAGGQPGVGGTHYQVILSLPAGTEAEVSALLIDDQPVEITKVETSDGKLTISATENRSDRREGVSRAQLKPNFREVNPEKAQLTLMLNGTETQLKITDFKPTQSENYR